MQLHKKHHFLSILTYCLLTFSTSISAFPYDPFCEYDGPCYTPFCWEEEPACWRGFYLSGQLGGGWNRSEAKFDNANYFNTLGPTRLGSHFHFKPQGFIGGGALGYNYQRDCLVVGFEGGVQSLNLKKSHASPFFPATDVFSTNLQWLGNAKGRVGYAYKRWLTFISGGWAGGNVLLRFDDTSGNIVAKSREWASGWTIGFGVECQLWRCFSVGLAYDYIRVTFKHQRSSCHSCGNGVGLGTPKVSNRLQTQTLTLRLNYIYHI